MKFKTGFFVSCVHTDCVEFKLFSSPFIYVTSEIQAVKANHSEIILIEFG